MNIINAYQHGVALETHVKLISLVQSKCAHVAKTHNNIIALSDTTNDDIISFCELVLREMNKRPNYLVLQYLLYKVDIQNGGACVSTVNSKSMNLIRSIEIKARNKAKTSPIPCSSSLNITFVSFMARMSL